jgi:membrane-associated phospholipid phosphatase
VVPVIILALPGNALTFTARAMDGMPRFDGTSPEAVCSQTAPENSTPASTPTSPGKVLPERNYAVDSPFTLDSPKLLLADTAYVLTAPARWDKKEWLTFSFIASGIGAAAFTDKPVRSWVLHNRNDVGYDVVDNFHRYEVYYSVGALGLFYAGGVACDNPRARAVAIDGAATSLIASGIVTPGLKCVIGRARPSSENGTRYFTPFSLSNDSFPSGETTQAFAIASVVASHYDELWIKAMSYGTAGLIGLARIYHDQHWTSDVAAGALIGTAVGITVVRYNEKRRSDKKKQTQFFVAPLLTTNAVGISLHLTR